MKPITTYVLDDIRNFANEFAVLAFTNRWSAERFVEDHDTAEIITRKEARYLLRLNAGYRPDLRTSVACYIGSDSCWDGPLIDYDRERHADAAALELQSYDDVVGLCYPPIRL